MRTSIGTHVAMGFLSVTSARRRVSKRSGTRVEAADIGLYLGARARINRSRKLELERRVTKFTHWTFLWVFSPEYWENALLHIVQMYRLNLLC